MLVPEEEISKRSLKKKKMVSIEQLLIIVLWNERRKIACLRFSGGVAEDGVKQKPMKEGRV